MPQLGPTVMFYSALMNVQWRPCEFNLQDVSVVKWQQDGVETLSLSVVLMNGEKVCMCACVCVCTCFAPDLQMKPHQYLIRAQ